MIDKILSISNVGKFIDYKANPSKAWNSNFSQINIIYATNGSGKTTFSTIFKSLGQNNPELILLKKSIGKKEDPIIRIKSSKHKNLISFENKIWSDVEPEIEIFDIHFIEDNLFVGSYLRDQTKSNLLKLLLGRKGVELKNRCQNILKKISVLNKRIKEVASSSPKHALELKVPMKVLLDNLAVNQKEYFDHADPIFKEYTEAINRHLTKFVPNIKLENFIHPIKNNDFENFQLSLVLNLNGRILQFKSPDLSKKVANAKFSLSEGDKSAIAICFFLARLDIQGVSDKIILFDDPLSSFDYGRRTTTIYNLAKVATQCQQFFLLTHDIYFAKEFTEKLNYTNPLNLKIDFDGQSSQIETHNIYEETLSGIQKDLITVQSYLNTSKVTDIERRKVVRCIRPILEGIIKLKYFDSFTANDWLGDIISGIKKSKVNDPLHSLLPICSEIIELNDFTKRYHHSNNLNQNDNIDGNELQLYVDLLMKTMRRI
jgi:wobble nucleotide-excising tRNase